MTTSLKENIEMMHTKLLTNSISYKHDMTRTEQKQYTTDTKKTWQLTKKVDWNDAYI